MDLIAGIYGDGPLKQDGIETAMHVLDHLNAEKLSLASLCRTCLVVRSDMYSLTRHGNDALVHEGAQLPDMFNSFTDIKVDPEEGLPLQICELCKVQLENGYEFRQKCLNSDTILKKYLKPMALCINAGTSIGNKALTVNDLLTEPEKPLKSVKITTKPRKLETPDFLKNTDVIEKPVITDVLETPQGPGDVLDKPAFVLSDNLVSPSVPEVPAVPEVTTANDVKDQVRDVQYLEESESDLEDYCIIEVQPSKDHLEVAQTPKLETGAEELERIFVRTWPHFACNRCDKRFETAKTLKDHIRCTHLRQNPDNPFKCELCNDRFVFEKDLRLHMSLHESDGKVFTCNECNKQFIRSGVGRGREALRRHLSRHMESKRHECSVCGKGFAERYALHRHVRVHTGQQVEKKHMCHLCDKRFHCRTRLYAHLDWHKGDRPFVCAVCGKAFRTDRLLASHSIIHTEIKPYACDMCDRRFRHDTTLIGHRRLHTGERPFVCAVCGKAFTQNSHLIVHMRSHTGEKPFECPTCKRRFASSSTLSAHTRTHTGYKPRTCQYCGKKLSKGGFKSHIETHHNIRPYECAVCPRRFPTATRLRDHERVHTGEKPFQCDICEIQFRTKAQMQKHIRTIHDAENKQTKKEKRKTKVYNLETPLFLIEENAIDVQNINLSSLTDTEKLHIFDPNQIIVDTEQPVDVSEELVLQETETICLESGMNYVSITNTEGEYVSNIELIPIDDGGVSIAPQKIMIEGNEVSMYQLVARMEEE